MKTFHFLHHFEKYHTTYGILRSTVSLNQHKSIILVVQSEYRLWSVVMSVKNHGAVSRLVDAFDQYPWEVL